MLESRVISRVKTELAQIDESPGQRSIRLLRRDLRGAIRAAYDPQSYQKPQEFVESALGMMIVRRPHEREIIEPYIPDLYLHLANTEALLRENPPHLSFSHIGLDDATKLKVIVANDVNLLVEDMINSHPLLTAGTMPVSLSGDIGVFASVSPEVHASLLANETKPTVFTHNDVPFVAAGAKAAGLALDVSELLPLMHLVPEVDRVSGMIFTPSVNSGCGHFEPDTKCVIVGVYSGSEINTQAEIFDALLVAGHEIGHSKQFVNGLSGFPSLVDELDANYGTYRAFSSLSSLSIGMTQPEKGERNEYHLALLRAIKSYNDLRAKMCHPDPKIAFFADHNIANRQAESYAQAASINVDLFPF